MYAYVSPKPLIFNLIGEDWFQIRKNALDFVQKTKLTGKEAGNEEEQSYGILAEMVIRKELGLPEPDPEKRELGWDIMLPSGAKLDIKCRGGGLPFQELYLGTGNLHRESKHNFFARQLFDNRLDADLYLMTHLETPKPKKGQKIALPGTAKQRKWNLYVCGWVSKERVTNEGVYLPRGSITEQGSKWFAYRGQEIEFYHRHLNGLTSLQDMISIEKEDIKKDGKKPMNLHMTSVDALRIATDLVGHGILDVQSLDFLKKILAVKAEVPPILHPNQYYHLLKWLKSQGKASEADIEKLSKIMQESAYEK